MSSLASGFRNLKNSAMRVVGSVRESMTPVLKESQFHERGVLTPEEFVIAGDLLVSRCPTWAWAGAPEKKRSPYLPKSKQYLVTQNIPCFERVSSLVDQNVAEEVVESGEGGDDGWLATHVVPGNDEDGTGKCGDGSSKSAALREASEEDEIFVGADGRTVQGKSIFSGVKIMEDYNGSGPSLASEAKDDGIAKPVQLAEDSVSCSESDDDYADLSAFEDMSLVQDDPAALQSVAIANSHAVAQTYPEAKKQTENQSRSVLRVSEPVDNVQKCRRYDISITYDKYYQTPRVWLLGYDERGQPLTSEQIFEDIMQDYANKTVTIEKHPHAESRSSIHASIHPCKHASVMKKIVDRLNEGDGQARVDMYLFIFLKFIQSVVPTMVYDFTVEVEAEM